MKYKNMFKLLVGVLVGILLCILPAFSQNPFRVHTFKCSAAMVCVDLIHCDQYGIMAKNVISLTSEEEAFRSPVVPCKMSDGSRGVCCRDPDYKDDWPTTNVTRPPPTTKPPTTTPPITKPPTTTPPITKPPTTTPPNTKPPTTTPPITKPPTTTPPITKPPTTTPPNTKPPTTTPPITKPPTTTPPITKPPTTTPPITTPPPTPPPDNSNNKEPVGCPRRKRDAMPNKSPGDENRWKDPTVTRYEAGAGEFPWQGAIYSNSNYKCPCTLTGGNRCITTKSCVNNYKPDELKVWFGIYDKTKKGGKAESFGCTGIYFESARYDIAVLEFSPLVNYGKSIKAICLEMNIRNFTYNDCVVTGWGKSNTARYSDVDLLSEEVCEKNVKGFDAETMSCGSLPKGHDACELVEPGAGLVCREIRDRKEVGQDIYYFKGTYSGLQGGCSPNKQILTFSRLNQNSNKS